MNPSTGTFISMDKYQGTIHDPISLHKYLYANSNPVMYRDPTGYSSYTLAESMETVTIMGILAETIVTKIGPALEILAFLTSTAVVIDYTVSVIPDIIDTGWDLLNGTAGVGDVTWNIREDVVFKTESNTDDKEKAKEDSNKGAGETVDDLPSGWTKTTNNGFTHIKDANRNIRVRIDPPDAKTSYPHKHLYDDVGNSLDINGNIVSPKSPDAHIPLK